MFRYRARSWPETLSAAEQARWDEFRLQRLQDDQAGASITLAEYRRQLSLLAIDTGLPEDRRRVVHELLDWPARIGL